MPDLGAVARLAADGYLCGAPGAERATPRWQAALARASAGLQQRGAAWAGLKVPVAVALLERYPGAEEEEFARLVEAMAEIEAAALAPLLGGAADPPG